jgi:hypothetical protein
MPPHRTARARMRNERCHHGTRPFAARWARVAPVPTWEQAAKALFLQVICKDAKIQLCGCTTQGVTWPRPRNRVQRPLLQRTWWARSGHRA